LHVVFSQTRNLTIIAFTDANVSDFNGATQRLKATVPDRRA